jgi:hypothetical protein
MTYRSFRSRLTAALASAAVLLTAATTSHAAVSAFPGLVGVRIWEFSGGPNAHTYLPLAPQLLNQLPVLNNVINDFTGVPVEPYDVFYSDASGAPNPLGNYLTVEAKYPFPNVGGGLNLGAVDLLIGPAPFMICRADILASFVGLGPNYIPGSELNAVDPFDTTPIPATATTMGSNPTPLQRMRVTVGWKKILVPEPATAGLSASAAAALGLMARRRRGGAPTA